MGIEGSTQLQPENPEDRVLPHIPEVMPTTKSASIADSFSTQTAPSTTTGTGKLTKQSPPPSLRSRISRIFNWSCKRLYDAAVAVLAVIVKAVSFVAAAAGAAARYIQRKGTRVERDNTETMPGNRAMQSPQGLLKEPSENLFNSALPQSSSVVTTIQFNDNQRLSPMPVGFTAAESDEAATTNGEIGQAPASLGPMLGKLPREDVLLQRIMPMLDYKTVARFELVCRGSHDLIFDHGKDRVWKEQARKAGMPDDYRNQTGERYKERLKRFLEEKKQVDSLYPKVIVDLFGDKPICNFPVFNVGERAGPSGPGPTGFRNFIFPGEFEQSAIMRGIDKYNRPFISFCCSCCNEVGDLFETVFTLSRRYTDDADPGYFCVDDSSIFPYSSMNVVTLVPGTNIYTSALEYLKRLIDGQPCGWVLLGSEEQRVRPDGTSVVRLESPNQRPSATLRS